MKPVQRENNNNDIVYQLNTLVEISRFILGRCHVLIDDIHYPCIHVIYVSHLAMYCRIRFVIFFLENGIVGVHFFDACHNFKTTL